MYVLECESGKVYIGATANLDSRLQDHYKLGSLTTAKEGGVRSLLQVYHYNSMWHAVAVERVLHRKYRCHNGLTTRMRYDGSEAHGN